MCQCCLFQSKEMVWEVTRSFPPVRACLFSQSLTVITFLGDPSAGSGLPRGTMVFANQPIPKEVGEGNVEISPGCERMCLIQTHERLFKTAIY